MKKIIAILMCVTLLVVCATTTVYAVENEYVDSAMTGEYFTETEIAYHAYSTYTVTIPAFMECSMMHQITIDAANVEEGYRVNAYITNMDENGLLTVTSSSGSEGKVCVYIDGMPYTYRSDKWIYGFERGGTRFCNIAFESADGYRPYEAGMYYGVVCFRFECNPY